MRHESARIADPYRYVDAVFNQAYVALGHFKVAGEVRGSLEKRWKYRHDQFVRAHWWARRTVAAFRRYLSRAYTRLYGIETSEHSNCEIVNLPVLLGDPQTARAASYQLRSQTALQLSHCHLSALPQFV